MLSIAHQQLKHALNRVPLSPGITDAHSLKPVEKKALLGLSAL